MAMNIKNEEAHRLAQELAKKTGKSLTETVTEALREKLDNYDQSTSRRQRLVQFIKESKDSLTEEQRNVDLTKDLYNEQGLPH